MLEIRRYPDPFLREISRPVEVINAGTRQLAEEMIETMYASHGVGLAAPQVGVHRRVVIVDFEPGKADPRVLINPRVVKKSSAKHTDAEGCLSVPGIEAKVTRPAEVTVEAMDLDGQLVEYRGTGLTAKALQHEIDHLDGILFIDKVTPASRQSIREELKRLEEAFATRTNPAGPGS